MSAFDDDVEAEEDELQCDFLEKHEKLGIASGKLDLVYCDACALILCVDCDRSRHVGPKEGHIRVPYSGSDNAFEGELCDEIEENQLIEQIDREYDSHSICQRLFLPFHEPPLKLLSLENILSLHQRGFFILEPPRFHPDALALALAVRSWAFDLYTRDQLKPPGVALAHDPHRDVHARGDYTGWLPDGDGERAGPGEYPEAVFELIRAFHVLKDDLMQALRLEGHSEKQLAIYAEPGTGYSRHRDALPDSGDASDVSAGLGKGTQRRITAIFYTSDDWDEAKGGCLRIHPTPAQKSPQVDVAPLAGRLLVFLSGCVTHEVLPSFDPKGRVAITLWFW